MPSRSNIGVESMQEIVQGKSSVGFLGGQWRYFRKSVEQLAHIGRDL